MKPWETHLPVLNFIFDTFQINKALEFGMGQGSTPFLLSRCKELISIDHDPEWVKVVDSFENKNNIKHDKYCLPPSEFLDIFEDNSKFDLIFVDGEVTTRVPCLQESFNYSDLLVLHDTEEPIPYKYHTITMPSGWVKYDYIKISPWTSIYTNNVNYILPIIKFLHDTISTEYFERPPQRFTIDFWKSMGRV